MKYEHTNHGVRSCWAEPLFVLFARRQQTVLTGICRKICAGCSTVPLRIRVHGGGFLCPPYAAGYTASYQVHVLYSPFLLHVCVFVAFFVLFYFVAFFRFGVLVSAEVSALLNKIVAEQNWSIARSGALLRYASQDRTANLHKPNGGGAFMLRPNLGDEKPASLSFLIVSRNPEASVSSFTRVQNST